MISALREPALSLFVGETFDRCSCGSPGKDTLGPRTPWRSELSLTTATAVPLNEAAASAV